MIRLTKKRHFFKKYFVLLIIFFLAFLPRLLGADLFVNIDGAADWLVRSEAFMKALLSGSFSDTFLVGYPYGVSLTWLSGSLMAFQNLISGQEVLDFSDKANLLLAAKMPIIIIASLTIALAYLIINKITESKRAALLCSLFLLIDPFFLAHSRFFQLDALMASFSILSLLLFLLFLKEHQRLYLIFSGVAAALAFLSKSPAFILVPSFYFILTLEDWFKDPSATYSFVLKKEDLKTLLLWLAIGLLTFVAFFPAFWVSPIRVIKGIFGLTVASAGGLVYETPSLAHSSFLISNLYYPLFLLTRLPALTMIVFITALVFQLKKWIRLGKKSLNRIEKNAFYLLGFVALYFLFMFLARKQHGRYLLSIFLVIDLFCGFGLYNISRKFEKFPFYNKRLVYAILILFFLPQVFVVFANYPYYSTYRNALFPVLNQGKLKKSRAFSFGWGEGLEQAAIFLSKKKNSDGFVVASWYPQVTRIFFEGRVVNLEHWKSSDYIILYHNQVHRKYHPGLIRRTLDDRDIEPEKIIKINNYEYAWIYKTKKVLK